MRDAIEMEWAGVPSVAIVHKAMTGSANSMRRLSGMPEYPFLTVDYPHIPLAQWKPEEVRALAKEMAPKVIEHLTKRGLK